MRFFFVSLFLLMAVGCSTGDPLPQPTGPWEPLNGWQPPTDTDQAAVPQ